MIAILEQSIMNLGIYRLLVTFCIIHIVRSTKFTRHKRTIIGYYPTCPKGCASCSPTNGCVTCSPNNYMYLYRNGMRQRGICTRTCPHGYFGVTRKGYSKCTRCRIPNCETCLDRGYCTSCTPPFVSHRGQCIEGCPPGMFYSELAQECLFQVDCEVTAWSGWTACTMNGQTCGYKYGIETRSRSVTQLPSMNGKRCPTLTENRQCRMLLRKCVDIITNKSDPLDGETPRDWRRKRMRERRRKKKKKIRDRRRKLRRREREKKKSKYADRDIATNQIDAFHILVKSETD
ncbi:R-spondin-2-like [Lineus longissimus]|uniref:R-spondin-2-like n=1 Tax=Lineus longissimus TaxID=88925 RepID=UPI00315D479B